MIFLYTLVIMEYLSIQQAIKHVKRKFNVPDKWKGKHQENTIHTQEKYKSSRNIKVSNSLLGLITNLGDKGIIKTRKTRGTFFYNLDELNKVFSRWDKMRKMKVKIEFKNVSPQFKEEAMSRIKKRMIMMIDVGISKYQVVDDKLFKYYGKNKVKCTSF
ncbi:MAG: hypothetical protein VXV77_01635 [Bacteroidota bacterium]|nr:hypothetical protein [Bacteroidota bacterium]